MSQIALRNYFGTYSANAWSTEGLVGTDPELFVLNSDNQVIPAFRFLPKEAGRDSDKEPFADGFQTEFTPAASHCVAYVVDNIRHRMERLYSLALKQGGHLSFQDVVDIPDINNYADHEVELGCSPSMNAYGEKSVIPKNPRKVKFRTAGCHIHLGTLTSETNLDTYNTDEIVKFLDQVTGPIYTALFAGLENPKRRTMYGRAGEYRIKPYGIEYRTPAPAALVHPLVTNITFDVAKRAAMLLSVAKMQTTARPHHSTIFDSWKAKLHHTPEEARNVINFCNVDAARDMLEFSKEFYTEFLTYIYPNYAGNHGSKVFNFIKTGALSKVKPEGYTDAWRLKDGTYWDGHGRTRDSSVGNTTLLG